MPSKKTITPIVGGSYYHIFNRGINRQVVFFNDENYRHFLKQLNKYLSEYVDFLAYCLLPNHFHIILKVKDVIDFSTIRNEMNPSLKRKITAINTKITDEDEIGKIVVRQLKRMFISYSMSINNQEKRSGNLFHPRYKRFEITDQNYLEYAIFYTHFNPEKHGLTSNFRNYKYSSYKAVISKSFTNISRGIVLEIFDGVQGFINYHNVKHDEREDVVLE